MIPVYICEDEKEQMESIRKIVDNFIIINSFDMQIQGCFNTPNELLASITEQKPLTALYFLDIDLKNNMNGIQLAKEIRKLDTRAFIVFITTHEEMAILTLKESIEPLNFIVKGDCNFASQIEKCLKDTTQRFSTPNNSLSDIIAINISDNIIYVKKQDIFFIESASEPHKIIIHKEKEQITFRSSLRNMCSQLDHHFIKCHGSFIVNLERIISIDKNNLLIHFSNNETCPCSTRLYKKLVKLTHL